MNKRVVIWGDDHHNALGLLRMLGDHGFEIQFIVHRVIRQIAIKSKFCQKYVVVQSLEDGLQYLCSNYNDKSNKAVLLFTADVYAEYANNNLSKLQDFFYVSGVPREKDLCKINDKYSMSLLAQECGIQVPTTFLYPNDDLSSIKNFPIIVKPCSPCKKDFKTKLINSKFELQKVKSLLINEKRYVFQQFIFKKADALIYGCRTQDGVTYLSGVCVRNRWSDDGCGSFGYISSQIPETIDQRGIVQYLEGIDYKGIFSVEYALTENSAYFYEFNLRNDGTSVLFYQSGSNMALCYVNSCFGIKDEVPVKSVGTRYLINEIWDRFNVNDGLLSRKEWEADYKKSTIFFYYDENDMEPYNIQLSMTIKRYIRRIISKSIFNKYRLKIKRYMKM